LPQDFGDGDLHRACVVAQREHYCGHAGSERCHNSTGWPEGDTSSVR
jgi:hypothetical protein